MGKYSGLSTGEILAAMDREKEVYTTRGQFYCALAAWIVSILAVPAAVLAPSATVFIGIGVFIITCAIAGWVGIFTGKFPYRLGKARSALDWVNKVVLLLALVLFVMAFIVSVTSGGVPKAVDGGYAIMNGSEKISDLTLENYRFYRSARGAMLSILTAFNCLQLAYVKKGLVG